MPKGRAAGHKAGEAGGDFVKILGPITWPTAGRALGAACGGRPRGVPVPAAAH